MALTQEEAAHLKTLETKYSGVDSAIDQTKGMLWDAGGAIAQDLGWQGLADDARRNAQDNYDQSSRYVNTAPTDIRDIEFGDDEKGVLNFLGNAAVQSFPAMVPAAAGALAMSPYGRLAAAAGAMMGDFPVQLGTNVQKLREEGQPDNGLQKYGAAAAQSALNMVAPTRATKAALNIGQGAIGRAIKPRVMDMAKSGLYEAGTEMAQDSISDWQAGVDVTKMSPAELENYMWEKASAGAAGFGLGAGMHGAGELASLPMQKFQEKVPQLAPDNTPTAFDTINNLPDQAIDSVKDYGKEFYNHNKEDLTNVGARAKEGFEDLSRSAYGSIYDAPEKAYNAISSKVNDAQNEVDTGLGIFEDNVTNPANQDIGTFPFPDSAGIETATDPLAMETATDPLAMETATDPLAMETATDPLAMETATDPLAMETATDPLAMETDTDSLAMETATDTNTDLVDSYINERFNNFADEKTTKQLTEDFENIAEEQNLTEDDFNEIKGKYAKKVKEEIDKVDTNVVMGIKPTAYSEGKTGFLMKDEPFHASSPNAKKKGISFTKQFEERLSETGKEYNQIEMSVAVNKEAIRQAKAKLNNNTPPNKILEEAKKLVPAIRSKIVEDIKANTRSKSLKAKLEKATPEAILNDYVSYEISDPKIEINNDAMFGFNAKRTAANKANLNDDALFGMKSLSPTTNNVVGQQHVNVGKQSNQKQNKKNKGKNKQANNQNKQENNQTDESYTTTPDNNVDTDATYDEAPFDEVPFDVDPETVNGAVDDFRDSHTEYGKQAIDADGNPMFYDNGQPVFESKDINTKAKEVANNAIDVATDAATSIKGKYEKLASKVSATNLADSLYSKLSNEKFKGKYDDAKVWVDKLLAAADNAVSKGTMTQTEVNKRMNEALIKKAAEIGEPLTTYDQVKAHTYDSTSNKDSWVEGADPVERITSVRHNSILKSKTASSEDKAKAQSEIDDYNREFEALKGFRGTFSKQDTKQLVASDPNILNNVEAYEPSVQEAIKNLNTVGSQFRPYINKLKPSTRAAGISKADIIETPSLLLTDNKVNYPESVQNAMSIVGAEWLINESQDTLYTDHEKVAKILGMPSTKNAVINNDVYNFVSDWGMNLDTVAQTLGADMLAASGLRVNKKLPLYMSERIHQSLGLTALTSMENAGLVKITNVPIKLMNLLSAEAKGEKAKPTKFDSATTSFVRLNKDKLPEMKTMAEAIRTSEAKEAIKELFSKSNGEKMVSDKPVSTKQKTLKSSTTALPEQYKKNIDRAGKVKWRMVKDVDKLIGGVSDEFLLKVLKSPTETDLKRANLDEKAADESKRESLKREIEHIRNHVKDNEADLNKEFYMPYEAWKNFRMGTYSNTIDMQNSKLHRYMVSADGWTSKFKLKIPTKKDKESKNRLHLTIGQGLDISFDKQVESKALKEFKTVYNASSKTFGKSEKGQLAKEGTDIIKILLLEGSLNTNEENRLAEIITAFGEKTHSYAALTTLAKYDTALKNGDASFEHNLPIEVDGITNGTANALMQYSDYSEKYRKKQNATGIFFKGDVPAKEVNGINVQKMIEKGQKDNYVSSAEVASEILKTMKRDESNAVSSAISDVIKGGKEGNKPYDSLSMSDYKKLSAYFTPQEIASIPSMTDEERTTAIKVVSAKVKAAEEIMGKFDRGTFKSPLMVFQYMAGNETIAKNHVTQMIGNYMGKKGLKQQTTDRMFAIKDAIENLEYADLSPKEVKEAKQSIEDNQAALNTLSKQLRIFSMTMKGNTPPSAYAGIPYVEGNADAIVDFYNKNNNKLDPTKVWSEEAYAANKKLPMVGSKPKFAHDIFKVMHAVSKSVFEKTFQQEYGELVDTRKRMNLNATIANKAFVLMKEARVEAAKQQFKEEGKPFTQVDLDNILNDMRNTGKMLTIKAPMSEDMASDAHIFDKDKVYLERGEGGYTKIRAEKGKGKITSTTYQLKPGADANVYSNYVPQNDVVTQELGGTVSVKDYTDNLGVKLIPGLQISMDAYVNNIMMGKHDVLNVHDAILISANDVHEISKTYNEVYNDVIQWDMVASIEKSTSRVINEFVAAVNATDGANVDGANVAKNKMKQYVLDQLGTNAELEKEIFGSDENADVLSLSMEQLLTKVQDNFAAAAKSNTETKQQKLDDLVALDQYTSGNSAKYNFNKQTDFAPKAAEYQGRTTKNTGENTGKANESAWKSSPTTERKHLPIAEEMKFRRDTQRDVDVMLSELSTDVSIVAGPKARKLAKKLGIKDYSSRMDDGSLHGFADSNINPDGSINVYVNPRLSPELRSEILAHELGHALMYNSDLHPRNAKLSRVQRSAEANEVLDSFKVWLESQGRDTVLIENMIKSKKSPLAALHYLRRNSAKTKLADLDQETKDYVLQFDEWFADEASKALLNTKKASAKKYEASLPFFDRFVLKLINILEYLFKDMNVNKPLAVNASVERFINNLRVQPEVTPPPQGPKQKEVSKMISDMLAPKLEPAGASKDIGNGVSNMAVRRSERTFTDRLYNAVFDKDMALRRLAKKKNSAALEELADKMFSPREKHATDQSYWHRKQQAMAKFDQKALNITRDMTKLEQAKVLSELYEEKLPDSAVSDGARQFRSLFRDLAEYMQDAGVKVNLRENYFPEMANRGYILDHKEDFMAMVGKYSENMQSIADSWNEDIAKRNKDIKAFNATSAKSEHIAEMEAYSAEDIPLALYENLSGEAQVKNVIEQDSQHTPFVRSLNHRVIDFLKGQDALEWKTKYLERALLTATQAYIQPVVKRVEYEKLFGALNEKERGQYVKDELKRLGTIPTKEEIGRIHNIAMMTNKMDNLLTKGIREDNLTREDVMTARDHLKAELGYHGRNTAIWLNEKLGIPMPNDTNSPIWKPFQFASSTLMTMANVMVLALSSVSSLVDPIGISVRTGDVGMALKAWKNGLKSAISGRDELQAIAEAVGSISDVVTKEALEQGYNLTTATPTTQKVNDFFFKWTGIEAWTRTTRLMAVDGARSFLKFHDKTPNKNSDRFLKELGLKPGDIHYTKDGKVKVLGYDQHKAASPQRQAQNDRVKAAIAEFVDESILRPSPSQRPLWASDPHWALVFHLKSFMYSFHKTILTPMYKEARQGNMAPAMMVAMYIPAGIGIGLIKDIFKTMFDDDDDFTPNYKESWTAGQYILDGFEKSGLPGITQPIWDIARARQYDQSIALTLASPAIDYETLLSPPVPLNYWFK